MRMHARALACVYVRTYVYSCSVHVPCTDRVFARARLLLCMFITELYVSNALISNMLTTWTGCVAVLLLVTHVYTQDLFQAALSAFASSGDARNLKRVKLLQANTLLNQG